MNEESKKKEYLIRRFNELHIAGMPKVTHLHELKGDYINLTYRLPSGQKIKLWKDEKTYLAAELCKDGSERCFGLTAGDGYLLVCEYGANGSDAEIIVFQKI